MSSITAIIKLLLLSSIIAPALAMWRMKNVKKENVCTTPACIQRGKEYLRNMKKGNPCHDFFEFTCGNWEKHNIGPKYVQEWTVSSVLNQHTLSVIRDLLENGVYLPKEKNYILAKLVYDTCSRIPDYQRTTPKNISAEIRRIGRYPNVPLWELHNSYLELTGESAFFDFMVLAHTPREQIPVLMLTEPEGAYGAVFHSPQWTVAEEQVYSEFLFHIVRALKLRDDTDKLIKDRIKKVLKFRMDFNTMVWRNRQNTAPPFKSMTIYELEDTLDLTHLTEKPRPPWSKIVRILLRNLPTEMVETRNIVSIRRRGYFHELIKFLDQHSAGVLALHVELHFIERNIQLTDEMLHLLEATLTQPVNELNQIRINKMARWERCIETFNVQQTLGELFIEHWFPDSYRETVHNMIQNVKLAIQKQMPKSRWLNSLTRLKINSKLDAVEEWIGFPPWYRNSSTVRPSNSDDMDIIVPNASFDIDRNVIYVHATIMTSPVYDPELPEMYNYATLGSTLGHELYHMIQDCGSYTVSHEIGTVKRVWWSDEMRKACLIRKICFVVQYDLLTSAEYRYRYRANIGQVDTSVSFTENFPDVMGAQAAYAAYKAKEKIDKSVCATLPYFEDFNCGQMFFIAMANMFCGYTRKKLAISMLNKEKHSLNSIRVNGIVSHNKDFAKFFGCPPGSPMNPQRKCDIWQ